MRNKPLSSSPLLYVSKGAFRLALLSVRYGLLILTRKPAEAMSRLTLRSCSVFFVQLINQSVSQSVSQPVSQPVNQPVSRFSQNI